MGFEWIGGRYRVMICDACGAEKLIWRDGLICGAFAIGPDAAHGIQLVHIPTASVVAEADRVRELVQFHEKLMVEFGALDWRRPNLAALATADHFIRAQRLRQTSGCRP